MRVIANLSAASARTLGSDGKQPQAIAQARPARSIPKRFKWVLLAVALVLVGAGEIYVLTAGTSDSGESARLPLAESGIGLVERTLRSPWVSSALPPVAILVAFGLGGLHALTPGHHKVLTGAYLVGSGAGYREAILIGGATAFSHTATVIVVGLLALSPQGQALVSFYLRWLGLPAGLLVAGLGFWLLMRYLRAGRPEHAMAAGHGQAHDHGHGHDHGHEHSHHHATRTDRLTLGGLVGLGLMHGIVPTTDALAVLLVALSVNQALLGLILILAYSLGIASVLSAVGMLFLSSQGLLERFMRRSVLSRWGPAIAAATVSLLGLVMVARTVGL